MIDIDYDDDGRVLVTSSEVHAYGVRESVHGALEDFFGMVLDLYEELIRSEPLLSQALLRQLKILEQETIDDSSD